MSILTKARQLPFSAGSFSLLFQPQTPIW